MTYAETSAKIMAIPHEPIAVRPPKTKRMRRYGITPWERKRIDKQQVRLLKDALGL